MIAIPARTVPQDVAALAAALPTGAVDLAAVQDAASRAGVALDGDQHTKGLMSVLRRRGAARRLRAADGTETWWITPSIRNCTASHRPDNDRTATPPTEEPPVHRTPGGRADSGRVTIGDLTLLALGLFIAATLGGIAADRAGRVIETAWGSLAADHEAVRLLGDLGNQLRERVQQAVE